MLCQNSFDDGYRPETSVTFLLRGTGMFRVLFCIYPIIPYAHIGCQESFDDGYRPETAVIFLLRGTGMFLVLF